MLHKAYATIEALAAETTWPEHTTPPNIKDAAKKEFWPKGFSAGTARLGMKPGKRDLMVISASKPVSAAAVFTRNLCSAAPVALSKEHLRISATSMRAIVCNSGNANAATGESGGRDAKKMSEKTAEVLGIAPHEVLVASTGVIGVPLPMEKIDTALDSFSSVVLEDPCTKAAEAIMTTDTFPKFFALDVSLSTRDVRICGIAKGSGMICPDMATMLAFLVTDATIDHLLLQEMLSKANEKSFNTITVDGDTSTNDMAVIFSHKDGDQEILPDSRDAELFFTALESLMMFLARLIVRDGEGASKLVEISVEGALSEEDAKKIARTIANSNLVKTALYGEDANWGRIIAAAGRSGAIFDPENASIRFNDLVIFEPGYVSDFSEEQAKKILSQNTFTITVSVGNGPGKASVHTCDLSKEYIEINGCYRT